MKKMILMMALATLISGCESEGGESPRKPRVDIPLTKGETQLVYSGNDFAFSLFRKITDTSDNPSENVFISPLSASFCLGMLNNGASGDTRSEIQQALGFAGVSQEEMNCYYLKMLVAMGDLDPQVIAQSANSIWVRQNFPVLPSFTDINKQYFQAEVKNVDFSNPQTLGQINSWCSDKTQGKIPSILDNINSETMIYLVNALYFKGEWSDKFDKKHTRDEKFTNADGSVSTVPMMNRTEDGLYYENDQFALTTLPYGNEAFSMAVLLPHEGVSLSSVVKTMDAARWKSCFEQMSGAEIVLKLPCFKIDYEIDLMNALKNLGTMSMFDASVADFSLINPGAGLYISLVKQKTYVNVNEEGTEAAAVTIIGGETMAPGPSFRKEFYVDRPFLYVIKEYSTGAIYFMGQVNHL